MRSIFYYIRIFFVSLEFLVILLGGVAYLFIGESLRALFDPEKLDEEAIKWFASVPLLIAGWTIIEARKIIYPDDKTAKILNEWSEYWKLKAHFYVGIFFCMLFALPCFFMWLFIGLKSFESIWFYLILNAALLANAGSFYFARDEIKLRLSALN